VLYWSRSRRNTIFDDLLKTSDIVSLHPPLTADTHNIARGGLVQGESLHRGHPLLALKNVVTAPHLAWLTQETLERSIEGALHSVDNLRAGLPLANRVA
jgi:phosphoglycerate dehydrogenase-like enzyme